MSHYRYRHRLEDLEAKTGKVYKSEDFPSPTTTPPELLSLVAQLKVFGATARKQEIHSELSEYLNDNGIASPPRDLSESLDNELKECTAQENEWAAYTGT